MPGKRRVIAPRRRGKRYVRRDRGRFTADQTRVGRSLVSDRRRRAKGVSRPGYGDEGDRPRRKGPKRAARRR
jgi:hypothetical protein